MQGKLYYELSKILGVSNFFLVIRKKFFKRQGIEGIKLGYKGSQGYLTKRQADVVVEWLKNKEYWNEYELVTYVEQEFGVIYKSKESYYELFAKTNISWEKNQKIHSKSDE